LLCKSYKGNKKTEKNKRKKKKKEKRFLDQGTQSGLVPNQPARPVSLLNRHPALHLRRVCTAFSSSGLRDCFVVLFAPYTLYVMPAVETFY
jgi:hypothetical protein